MSTIAKLSGSDFDRMVQRGAFVDLQPLKVELIYGELRLMNPAGPVHEGEIEYLTNWSYATTNRQEISIRVQCSIDCGDHRPEPDLVWVRRMNTKRIRPKHQDVRLLIEVADSSAEQDLGEKAKLYAEHGIPEYWGVDIQSEQVRVHRNPHNGRYQSIEPFDKSSLISPLCQPLARLSLADLFDLDA
ncbi:MAG: Uma2 family endonuclease [Planctomycetales bacterium]|nr:Uma2 family endonuclease [Planctomycetales bacterium]